MGEKEIERAQDLIDLVALERSKGTIIRNDQILTFDLMANPKWKHTHAKSSIMHVSSFCCKVKQKNATVTRVVTNVNPTCPSCREVLLLLRDNYN